MLKFQFKLPAFLASFLWPQLMQRARVHGKAGQSWRTKGRLVAVDVKVEDTSDAIR